MTNNTQAIQAAAERGAIVIALSQARREIDSAIAQVRNGDGAACGSICAATDLLVASYKNVLEAMIHPVVMEPRIWDLSEAV